MSTSQTGCPDRSSFLELGQTCALRVSTIPLVFAIVSAFGVGSISCVCNSCPLFLKPFWSHCGTKRSIHNYNTASSHKHWFKCIQAQKHCWSAHHIRLLVVIGHWCLQTLKETHMRSHVGTNRLVLRAWAMPHNGVRIPKGPFRKRIKSEFSICVPICAAKVTCKLVREKPNRGNELTKRAWSIRRSQARKLDCPPPRRWDPTSPACYGFAEKAVPRTLTERRHKSLTVRSYTI